MSVGKNIVAFKNWYMFYAERYGFLRYEFELIHRSGIKLRLRPNTDDLKIVKSNLVTKHYERDFVPITKGSVVIDVGAHIGSFTVMAAGIASKVLAFEPEPGNFQMLKKNVELNNLKNVSIFAMAVSGSSGYQDIFISDDASTGSHSLYTEDAIGGLRRRVETISLDDIIEKQTLRIVDFVKLDCEGAEHEIVERMSSDTAAKIMGIAMETHGLDQRTPLNIYRRLEALGFEVRMEDQGGYLYARRKKNSS
jgi:FkbM family methyltransferase